MERDSRDAYLSSSGSAVGGRVAATEAASIAIVQPMTMGFMTLAPETLSRTAIPA